MSVLLARTAERLLWGARYLERAEDTVRVARSYGDLVFDYSDEWLGWEPLAALTGVGDEPWDELPESDPSGERTVLAWLLADASNPSSVVSSVAAARSNLRTSREVLPREAWQAANQLNQYVVAAAAGAVERSRRDYFLQRVVELCRVLDGTLESTMTRGDAYYMLRIGRLIERADMTTRVLGVAAANALRLERLRRAAGQREDAVIDEVQWMSVLRSVSALQMYQRATHGPIVGIDVVDFLLADPSFPRSVKGCFGELGMLLTALPSSAAPLDALAAAESLLVQSEHDVVEGAALDRAMERIQVAIATLAECIHLTYVGSFLDVAPGQDAPAGGRLAQTQDA